MPRANRSTVVWLITTMACFSLTSWADVPAQPTFYKDVLPIVQENCQDCHRPQGANVMGMVAPMAFTSYEDTRPWAKAIVKQVSAREMPPWHAAPEFHGVFQNERTLTGDEIDTLVKWAQTGARPGNPADAPEPRAFENPDGWIIGEPDLIVEFNDAFFVPDAAEDLYHDEAVRLTKEQMPEDRYIKGMEFRPGSGAVHHIVIFTDSYRESLGFGRGMLGGMGPGTDPTIFPDGFGRLLEAESTIVFNMHYHKESGPGTGVYDKSSIAFTFHHEPVQHNVNWGAIGTHDVAIPPYANNHAVTAAETFHEDVLFLALFPHTHLRGKASKYVAHYPDGTKETLLHVPNYDFNWQTNYIFEEPKRIPKGTRVEVTMWYDNSRERGELAGIDPSRTVYWGTATTDEMMYGWIDYTRAQPMETAGSD